MVGVPSSRGCDACRKQKKRCDVDDEKPPCHRCARLKIDCVGYGGNRLKFQSENDRFPSLAHRDQPRRRQATQTQQSDAQSQSQVQMQSEWHVQTSSDHLQALVRPPPSSPIQALAAAFAHDIDSSVDISIQLPWNFGLFLNEIPRRLGVNPALDTATSALTTAYQRLKGPRDVATDPSCMKGYSKAIATLRETLSDPSLATSSETLCAINLLIIIEVMFGSDSPSILQHCGGASRLMKLRGFSSFPDEMERQLIMSLRGPVIIQSLFLDSSYFTDEEWAVLIQPEPGQGDWKEHSLLCLGEYVVCFHRLRTLKKELEAADGTRNDLTLLLSVLSKKLDEVELALLTDIVRLETEFIGLDTDVKSLTIGRKPLPFSLKFDHSNAAKNLAVALSAQIMMIASQKALACLQIQYNVWTLGDTTLEERIQQLENITVPIGKRLVQVIRTCDIHRPLGAVFAIFALRIVYTGIPRRDQLHVPKPPEVEGTSAPKEPEPGCPGYLERQLRLLLRSYDLDFKPHLNPDLPFGGKEDWKIAAGAAWLRNHFHLGVPMPQI